MKKPESLRLLPHFKTGVLSTNDRALDGAGDHSTGAPPSAPVSPPGGFGCVGGAKDGKVKVSKNRTSRPEELML